MATTADYFSDEALRKDLKGKTIRGGMFAAVAQSAQVVVQLAAIPILGRLLRPEDFGLVAMVTVLSAFAAMFVDVGLSTVTLQRSAITHAQVSNLFWTAMLLGCLIAALFAVSAPLIAWFYGEPRLVAITWAICPSLVFAGLTMQHQALLRRAMQFRVLAAIHVVSFVSGYVLAVGWAWWYRNYWAMVLLPVTMAFVRMVGTWWACHWHPSLPQRGVGMRNLVGFGANLTVFNFVKYFARNADYMLIGWWWGGAPLGYYERAYKLMMAPLIQINGPLTNIMVPALSRLRDQPNKYRLAYFRAVGILQIVSCPLMAFVGVTAPFLVDVVFGPGWEEVTPILRWLALAGLMQPLISSLGWLYISQGRGRELMHTGLVGGTLIVLSFVLGLPWGPVGVAAAYALVIYVPFVPLSYWYVGRKGCVTAADLWRLTGSATLYALPAAAISALVLYRFPHLPSMRGIAICGLASIIASLCVVFCTRAGRTLVAELAGHFHRALTSS